MNQHLVRIEYAKTFSTQLKKMPLKVKIKTRERIILFQQDRRHTQLHDHALKGKYQGYRSINITGDVRALYYEKQDGKIVLFAFIGTHSQLY